MKGKSPCASVELLFQLLLRPSQSQSHIIVSAVVLLLRSCHAFIINISVTLHLDAAPVLRTMLLPRKQEESPSVSLISSSPLPGGLVVVTSYKDTWEVKCRDWLLQLYGGTGS